MTGMSTAAPKEPSAAEQALTVAQLTAQIKSLVEDRFPSVWVAGEISNFSRPQSGHCYFTLKDDAAQIRAVIWRGTAARLKTQLGDGMEIVCRGRLDVYPPRGSYQLVVEQLQAQGLGALELALRKLRDKLAKEGLFDASRKRSLPPFPRRIGFVTSPTGAAIRDFLEVMRRRWQGIEVFVIPTRVQGDGAAREIAEGLQLAAQIRPALDLVVVGRGGGSLEDLWCFNEEPVVRAIAASPIPTISAVGHEIDVTLADLAADVRALTPSEAAERAVPSAEEAVATIGALGTRLQRGVENYTAALRRRLDALATRPAVARPLDAVGHLARRVDDLSSRLHRSARVDHQRRHAEIAAVAGKLGSLSPLAVLGRGYSLTQRATDGRLVTDARQLERGDQIVTQLGRGIVESVVDRCEDKTRSTPVS